MAVYRYILADLRTNAILAELPMKGVNFGRILNGAGLFKGTVPLADPKVQAQDPFTNTQPCRTALYIDRDGALVWGGIIWTRTKNRGSATLAIQAAEFPSYWHKRRIAATATFAQQDQLAIVQSIANTAAARAGGNIGITVGSEVSGVLRDRTYNYYEFKSVYDAITELSAVRNGFNFSIDVSYVAGVPTKRLVLSYPRRGASFNQTGLMFEKPGNIIDYTYPEDGTAMEDTHYAIGAGQGDNMLRSSASVTSLIDAGYPLLEGETSYKDISVQSTLDAHAQADVEALSSPVTTAEVWVVGSQDPGIGAWTTGDDVRVRIVDERFNSGYVAGLPAGPGLDTYFRVIAYDITPEDDAQPEEAHLVLGATG